MTDDAPAESPARTPLGRAPSPHAPDASNAAPRASPKRRARDHMFGAGATLWAALRDGVSVAGRAYRRFAADDGWVLSGFIAYSVLLALFPFMIFTAALASASIGPDGLEAAMIWVFEQTPPDVASALQPVLLDVLGKDRGGLLTITAAGAIWAASNGVDAFHAAFDRAYEVREPRRFVVRRLVGLGFVILGSITFATLGVAIVLAPLMLSAAEALFGVALPMGIGVLRYGVGMGALVGFLWIMHRFLPSRRQRGTRLLPGIIATLLLWMSGATAFSVYLSHVPSYTVTYGGIAGIIITLLFFYLTGAAIIYGAEVNAAIERRGRDARLSAPNGARAGA